MSLMVIRNGNIVKSAAMPSDQYGYVRSELLPPYGEEYLNHLGNVDNFTQTAVTGNGTATSDATNHRMNLVSGTGVGGHARFETKKGWILSSKPIITNFIVQNIVDGVGGYKYTPIGLGESFAPIDNFSYMIVFMQYDDNAWYTHTRNVTVTSTSIAPIANNDLLTIVATSTKASFFVNGILVSEHTTNIPTGRSLKMAGSPQGTAATTTSREIAIDMMSIKVFK